HNEITLCDLQVDILPAIRKGVPDILNDPLHILGAAFAGYVVEEIRSQLALGRAQVAILEGFLVEAADQGFVLVQRHLIAPPSHECPRLASGVRSSATPPRERWRRWEDMSTAPAEFASIVIE